MLVWPVGPWAPEPCRQEGSRQELGPGKLALSSHYRPRPGGGDCGLVHAAAAYSLLAHGGCGQQKAQDMTQLSLPSGSSMAGDLQWQGSRVAAGRVGGEKGILVPPAQAISSFSPCLGHNDLLELLKMPLIEAAMPPTKAEKISGSW